MANVNTRDEIQNLHLNEIDDYPGKIDYQDSELVIIDNLRDFPDFSAYKIAFNVAIVCINGKLQAAVNGKHVSVYSNQALICHSNVMVTDLMASPDIACRVICLSDRILKDALQGQYVIWNKLMFPYHTRVIDFRQNDIIIFDALTPVFRGVDSPLKKEILVCLLRAGFLVVCDLFLNMIDSRQEEVQKSTRTDALFHQFIETVAARRVKKMSVAFYASQLYITPKYLTTVCKKASGKSPSAWITEYVIEDVIYYLKNTEHSSKEIAHRLGFCNVSFFGKFVKAHLGMTPLEYRRSAWAKT